MLASFWITEKKVKINRKKAHLTLTLAPKKWYNYTITIKEKNQI